jgi:hypothetical protein
MQPLWVNDRTLLFSTSSNRSVSLKPTVQLANTRFLQPIGFFSSRTRELLAFDVTNPALPKFASQLELGGDRAWTVGPAMASNDSVYLSYKVVPHSYQVANGAALDDDPEQADANKHYLKQIDYSDSANPVVSDKRVNLPGELRALSRQGALLYTVGSRRHPVTGDSLNNLPALQASGFDGTLAHLLDQLSLERGSQPFTVAGETVFLLDPQPEQSSTPQDPAAGSNAKKSSLATWQVNDDGKFMRLDSVVLGHEVAFRQFDGLTVLRGQGPTVRMIDSRDPQALRDLGAFDIGASGGSSLERADADLQRGLWLPLGSNGVTIVPLGR